MKQIDRDLAERIAAQLFSVRKAKSVFTRTDVWELLLAGESLGGYTNRRRTIEVMREHQQRVADFLVNQKEPDFV